MKMTEKMKPVLEKTKALAGKAADKLPPPVRAFVQGPKGKAAVGGGVVLAIAVFLSVGLTTRLADAIVVSSDGLTDNSILSSDEVAPEEAAGSERNVAREVRTKLEKMLEDRDEWGPGYSLHSIELKPNGRNAFSGTAKVSSIDFEKDLKLTFTVAVGDSGVKVENFRDSFD